MIEFKKILCSVGIHNHKPHTVVLTKLSHISITASGFKCSKCGKLKDEEELKRLKHLISIEPSFVDKHWALSETYRKNWEHRTEKAGLVT